MKIHHKLNSLLDPVRSFWHAAGGQPSPRLGARLAGRLVDRALVGFGDFLGCGELAGWNAERVGKRPYAARRGLYAAGFEA